MVVMVVCWSWRAYPSLKPSTYKIKLHLCTSLQLRETGTAVAAMEKGVLQVKRGIEQAAKSVAALVVILWNGSTD